MFRRGFKTWCERTALEKRTQLGLKPTDALDPWRLAEQLGIRVWTPEDVPGLSPECMRVLLRDDSNSWSAVTLRMPIGDLIILNSSHSKARQASDLVHELAHLVLGHTPSRVDVTEDQQLLLRTHDPDQEEEAGWLAGCLLLPRPALLAILRTSDAERDTARRYGVSVDMLTYRLRVTGVEVQARRSAQWKASRAR